MGRTFVRQISQILSSDTYDDTIVPSLANFETNPTHIETDLNALRSGLSNVIDGQAGDWYTDLLTPSALESGSQRGVNDLNTDLHAVEKKRVLRDVYSIVDVVVGGSDNWVILGTGELPAQALVAVGAVTTLGTVIPTYGGTFGSHALYEQAGANAINPLNLCTIVDGSTRDPILSGGKEIFGLLQGEIGLTDGDTATDTTTDRLQLSFVITNATGDDLIACPAGDIQGKTVNYATRERVRLEDLNEQDFLKGAAVDTPGASTVDRQTAYTNQGVTVVTTAVTHTLDLGAGLLWKIGDLASADLFVVTEGSGGGSSEVALEAGVDTFRCDAVLNDFDNGIAADTGAAGTTLNLGVTANQLDSGGALKVLTTAADLSLEAGLELNMTDSYRAGSSWSLAAGMTFADSSAEWSAFETNFGEVSLLNGINQAFTNSGRTKGYGVLTAAVGADTDIALTTAANLDADLPDFSGVDAFVDDCDVFLNGEQLRTGANAAANHDVYPGTTPGVGMLKFEFGLTDAGANPDVLCMIVHNN